MTKRVGILTAGSDSSGLNAAIRAVGKALQGEYGLEILGFQDGFQGLVEDRTVTLDGSSLSGILTDGGTILGTSRDQPHQCLQNGELVDLSDQAVQVYQKHRLSALVCIGGRETQEAAFHLMHKGLNVITLPKAIDNNVNLTDLAIGFDSAREIATNSIDRLHSTAYSHHRILIVEIMSRYTGWLTLGAGLAGGADVILIPEIPYDLQKVAEAILRRNQAGKRFSLIAVSERVISQEQIAFRQRLRQLNAQLREGPERDRVDAQLSRADGLSDSTYHVANRLKEHTGLETRMTILGYLLRGGAPSAADRVLATQLGTACADFIHKGRFGILVAVRNGRVEPVALTEAIWEHKRVPLDHPWIECARSVGTHLGD